MLAVFASTVFSPRPPVEESGGRVTTPLVVDERWSMKWRPSRRTDNCPTAGNKLENLWTDAEFAFERGDIELAEALMASAERLEPDHARPEAGARRAA